MSNHLMKCVHTVVGRAMIAGSQTSTHTHAQTVVHRHRTHIGTECTVSKHRFKEENEKKKKKRV